MSQEIGLLLLSGDGSILWASTSAATLLGYSAAELCELALPLTPATPDAPAPPFGPVASAFREIMEGTVIEVDGLARFRTKDQKRIAVHWKLWSLPKADGRPPQVLLSVSEASRFAKPGPLTYAYHHDFEDAVEGIFRCTIDGALMEVNVALANLLGYRNADVLKGSLSNILSRMYLRPERHTEFVSTLNHHGSVNGFEAEMWRADGTVMWVSVIARTIHGNEGQPLYFEGRVFDITARKRAELALRRSEQRFRKLVETTGVIPFEFDLTTKQFSYLGPQAEVLLGESLRTGCSLSAWMAVVHPDDLEIGTRFLSGASSFVGVDTQVEFRMRAPGGRLIWIKQIVHSGEPAEDAEHARGFLLDITEAKQLEVEREHSQLKLRQLAAQSHNVREEERMIIAREIHDELGQALTLSKIGIAWLGGRLVKTVEEEVRKPLEEKITELDRMLDATLDTVRRILSALRPPLLDDLGLKAAMEFHVAEFSKRVGIRYDFQVAPHVQLPLGHATAIFRIFQEILTNIARHAKASRISIQAAEANSQFVLTVEDNGKGISPEDVRELKHFGILGMQERAWAIGGELEVYRRSGGGTRVALKVPLLPDVPEPPAHVEHPRITDKSKLDSGFHYRVKATVE